jgi:hypothetical protein
MIGTDNFKLREAEKIIPAFEGDENPSKVIIRVFDNCEKTELDALKRQRLNFFEKFTDEQNNLIDNMNIEIGIKQEVNKEYTMLDYIKENPKLSFLLRQKELKKDVDLKQYSEFLVNLQIKELMYSIVSIDEKKMTKEIAESLVKNPDMEFCLLKLSEAIFEVNNEKIVKSIIKN